VWINRRGKKASQIALSEVKSTALAGRSLIQCNVSEGVASGSGAARGLPRTKRLSRQSQGVFEEFKLAAVALSEVQECYLVSGNFDYLIKARVNDMDAYRKFLGETLLSLPGVQESTSYVVMEEVKETLNLALSGV